MSKVLLVEDDVWLGELYGKSLEREADIEVLYAKSAGDALKVLDLNSVDLIILDIFLGANNGIELLHELASYNDTKKIPVLILSAVSEYDFGMEKSRWEQYGVIDYLYKPNTKPADLNMNVKAYFSKRHSLKGSYESR